MKKLLIATSLLSTICLTGCATMFGDHGNTVNVNSNPSWATVYVDGMPINNTPTIVPISSKWSSKIITVKKEGFQPKSMVVNTEFQPITLLDIFFWPGFIIDAATGNMMKISDYSKNINVTLERN